MRKIILSAAFIISAATINLAQTRRTAGAPPARPAVITDNRVYTKSLPPPLPRAGGTLVDPTFGMTIMRVTDVETYS